MEEHSENEACYWELKRKGNFREGYWVVIKEGKLLLETEAENDALDAIFHSDGMCSLFQVGNENYVVEMDGVEGWDDEDDEGPTKR